MNYEFKLNGYEKAAKIDSIICSLLKKYPLVDFPREWAKLSRTAKTTFQIIERESYKQLKGGD